MANLVGKTLLNRYNVTEFLGRGAMAEVYKVWDSERAVHLAMKVMHADLAEDRVFLRRFKREANNLAQLQHPHIVRFYGLEQDQFLVFMLMDFVEGMSLKTRIFRKGAPFTPAEAKDVLKPLTSALHFAHKRGLVHCDIKPANIMLDKHGEVRLADFGIARMSETATATMVGAGTPAYMAPEQIRGEDPTPQSDIYALGIVLYEMLTGGERPFTGEQATITGSTSEKVRWEQLNLAPTSPRHWHEDISSAVEAVILKCLEKEPSQRYQSALELLNAFELAVGGQPAAERPQPAPATVKKTPAPPIQKPPKPTSQPDPTPDRSSRSTPPASKEQRPVRFQSKWLPVAGVFLIVALVFGFISFLGGGSANVSPTQEPTLTFAPVHTATPTNTAMPSKTPTPSMTPTLELGIGSTMISEKDDMVMVYVPAGEFEMGSKDGGSDERPIHVVYLDAFWIDQTEVTNAMYAKCLDIGICGEPAPIQSVILNDMVYANHPVKYVDWNDAVTYCEWVGRRLPSEAEWEKAARGGLEGAKYPWGDETPTCHKGEETGAQFGDCNDDTAPVASFSPNGYGLYDMSGNVSEWVNDWYDEYYYASSPKSNPAGPTSGDYKVFRGGSFINYYSLYYIRSAVRKHSIPNTVGALGFRCARSHPIN